MKKLLFLGAVLLLPLTARAESCPAGCAACSGLECTSCAAGYYKTGIRCVACPSGTWAKEGATECSSCSDISIKDGTCTACLTDGECTEVSCDAGKVRNGLSCGVCNAGQYADGDTCKTCPAGTYARWSNGICRPCPQGSWSKAGDSNCTAYNMTIPNGRCIIYSQDGTTCLEVECNIGYQIDYQSDGATCEKKYDTGPCSVNCTSCNDDGTCNQCETGYKLDRLYKRYCVNQAKCEANPLAKLYYGLCKCAIGYYQPLGASDDVCIACPEGCSDCSRSGQCGSCVAGYYMKQGNCIKIPVRENVEMDNGVCEKYTDDYGLGWRCEDATCSDGKSADSKQVYRHDLEIKYHRFCYPANCRRASDWGQCLSCESGYALQDGKCILKCKWYEYRDASGQCQPCSNIKVANGVCRQCSTDGVKCTDILCDDGYVFDSVTNACVKPVVCKYPLKEVTDYTGGCIGCCTD